MSYQNINATLSPAEMQAVKDAFATILNNLPFLVSLTPDESRAIFKTGPDSVSFVQTALTAAQANPKILPSSFDMAGYQKDVELFTALTELKATSASLTSQLEDTRIAVGGEAMQASMQTYNYIKAAAKTIPGLKPAAEQLGERFRRARKKGAGESGAGI